MIAIESEREFGLSVLQRLDQELRRRGDLFREAGVQSLAHFRQVRPQQPMPRILLIVDEFQEFFVSDDKISHEASLYLDRLVRQGRAFGMHVILGSQTLAGAYSLARSTIGQMAVRIALQCSSADAHLILSEDNTAARLLGRPGEAIYNDANGLLEGNHPFQVVWLSDQQRSDSLRQIAALAAARQLDLQPPDCLRRPYDGPSGAERAIAASTADRSDRDSRRWLPPPGWERPWRSRIRPGSMFRRQASHNLLLVGQNENAARGVLCSCVVSLAADRPPSADPQRVRAVTLLRAGRRFGHADHRQPGAVPGRAPGSGHDSARHPRSAPRSSHAIAQQVAQRQQNDEPAPEPIFLMISDLARFPQLQSDFDDFGLPSFGDRDQPASPAAQLGTILRDGPAVGIHTLGRGSTTTTICPDGSSVPNCGTSVYRVLFQMSAVDSSQLMDSTAASLLGGHRAILYQDTSGEAERFRPYGLPPVEWLEQQRLDGAD